MEDLVLQPLGEAGGHLGLELVQVLVPGGGEVPLQDLGGRGA